MPCCAAARGIWMCCRSITAHNLATRKGKSQCVGWVQRLQSVHSQPGHKPRARERPRRQPHSSKNTVCAPISRRALERHRPTRCLLFVRPARAHPWGASPPVSWSRGIGRYGVRATRAKVRSGRGLGEILRPGEPPTCLNFSNRPVRTRMPGGVAGAQSMMAAPYADQALMVIVYDIKGGR